MLTTILFILVAAVLAVLAFAATRPDDFTIQRVATIPASADKVFAQLDDFHNWPAWSPWEKLDPDMKRSHSGAEKGKGAVYAWEGNNKVGSGRMEILETTPHSKLVIQLDFFAPWKARNTTIFTLSPEGSGTKLDWAMHGKNDFMGKVMCLFMDMDKMVGKDFEKGLDALKTAAK